MTELFLDGMSAIPSINTSFKLNVENPYFTKTSTYSLEVELPIAIEENRRIFGDITRMDMEKTRSRLKASLVVDNRTVLMGEANITQVTDSAVKVQLLGESAAYIYGNKMDKTYIDELDLGDWYTTTWPDRSYYAFKKNADGSLAVTGPLYYPDDYKFSGTTRQLMWRAFDDIHAFTSEGHEHAVRNMTSGNYPWVAFPIINSTSGENFNVYTFGQEAGTDGGFGIRLYSEAPLNDQDNVWRHVRTPIAPQPFLWVMAQKIAQATGFTLEKEDNALYTDTLFRKIFIANNNPYILCNKSLPHWTVNEWWEQIERTFGVVMEIDYASARMKLTSRGIFFSGNSGVEYISQVVDQYTTEMEDSSESDISAENVGYDGYDNGPEDLLADYIVDSAEVMEFESLIELGQWALGKTAAEMATYKHVIFKITGGRQFIWSTKAFDSENEQAVTEGFIEVNMLRPRIVREDSSDLDVTLKIVPARFAFTDISVNGSASAIWYSESFRAKVMEAPGADTAAVTDLEAEIDIQNLIDGEEEAPDKFSTGSDLIYIGISNPNEWYQYPVKRFSYSQHQYIWDVVHYPQGWIRERAAFQMSDIVAEEGSVTDVRLHKEGAPYSLSLNQIDGQNNLAAHVLTSGGAVRINTLTRYCIKFISDHIPAPGAVYNIRNRLFVCEKIEAQIKPGGLEKLLTGYFYEYTPG